MLLAGAYMPRSGRAWRGLGMKMRGRREGRVREHIPASVLAQEWEKAGLSHTTLVS